MPRLVAALLLAGLAAAPTSAQSDPYAQHRIPATWQGHTYTPSPTDWRRLAVYQVMTDRFYNGNPGNDRAHTFSTHFDAPAGTHPTAGWRRTIGGDFKGLTEHLDYIKALGFDVVWISAPMLGTEPNGYAPTTYGILDPKLGTVAELRTLIDEAHERGMYVIVDCVANHFANWFNDQSSFNGGGWGSLSYRWPGQREYGYMFGDPLGPNDFHHNGWVNDWNDTWQLERGELVGLDDLKTETKWVRDYVIQKWTHLIKAFDIDGFRVDAIKHVNVRDMAEMTEAWRRAAASVGKRNFYMFGEAYSGSHGAVGYYTGNKANTGKRIMNGMMDYVMFLDGVPWKLFQDRWALKRWIEGSNNGSYDMGQELNGRWARGNMNLHFADNHDQPRFLSTVGDWDQMVSVTALMTMIEGVGALYYGSEQGFNTGGKNGVGAYPAMFDHPFQQGPSSGDKLDMTFWLYKKIAKVMRARRRIGVALGYGTDIQSPSNGLFAFKRGGDALVVINGTGQQKSARFHFGSGRFVDLVGGAVAHGPHAQVTLPKYGVAVFVKNGDPASLEPLVETVAPGHASRSDADRIVITFDRDMDAASTVAAASIHPDPGGSWSLSGKTLTHTGGTFRKGWMYTVRVARSAKGRNGQAMYGGFVSRFHSKGAGGGAGGGSTTPPVAGTQVVLRYAGGNAVSVKGSWQVTGGADGQYSAVYDGRWDQGQATPLVKVGGQWQIVLTLDPNKTYEYGFVVDGRWTDDPGNPNHASSGNDRFRTAGALRPPQVSGNQVTFRYAGGRSVAIKGSWKVNGGSGGSRSATHDPRWDGGAATSMVQQNGVWTITLTLEPGKTYEYGFVVDGRWTNDPSNPNHAGNGNDRVHTHGALRVLGRTVTLRFPGGSSALVLGSWKLASGSNGRYSGRHDTYWDGGTMTPMVKVNGEWQIGLTLEAGKTYEYGFMVDGRWQIDARNPRRKGNGNALVDLP